MKGQPEFWTERSVLVTGPTGMVGSWVVKDLVERGARVVALVLDADRRSEFYRSGCHRKVHIVNGRLEDFATLQRTILAHEVDTVIHLGAQAIVSVAYRAPLPTFETNVRGTWNLLEACRLHCDVVRRVVVASSDKVYGEQERLPVTEEMPLSARHPYEVSKACADMIAVSYHRTYGLPVAVARCGNIYGGGDLNWSRIVPGTIRSLLRGESPVIRSDGRYVRDYLYVKDASEAYLKLAECLDSPKVQGESFNISPESRVSVFEIVDLLRRMMKREDLKPTVLNEAKGEIRNQALSSRKAESLLGWKPAYTLKEGLRETIDWYKRYLEVRGE